MRKGMFEGKTGEAGWDPKEDGLEHHLVCILLLAVRGTCQDCQPGDMPSEVCFNVSSPGVMCGMN